MVWVSIKTLAGIVVGLWAIALGSDPVDISKFGVYRSKTSSFDLNQEALLELENAPSDFGFGESITNPVISVQYLTDNIARVTIRDSKSKRWEVPGVIQEEIPNRSTKAYLKVSLTSDNKTGIGFQVHRRFHGHHQTIFDAHGIVFADRFLRIRTNLPPDPKLYGFGERVTSLRLPLNETLSIMATDQLTPQLKPLYGSHPFYLEMRDGGMAHGVFALNSNAMEIDVDQDGLTYRFLGGVFDFYFFAGPSPKAVLEQYHSVIGRPSLPPAWHLGFHQCRWGYRDLEAVEAVVSNYTANNIPLDTVWNDLDYMNGYRIFTSDPERFPRTSFKSFLDRLHSSGRHYIPIIDPGVKIDPDYKTYREGVDKNVFLPAVPNPFTDDKFFVGQVWPGLVHFPDWTHPNTTSWWSDQIQEFHSEIPIDGFWTDMNEAANFCDGRCVLSASQTFNGSNSDNCNSCNSILDTGVFDRPWPETVRPPVSDRRCHSLKATGLDCGSISMAARHYNGAYEYDMHNLFGHLEAAATFEGLIKARQTRPVIVTRSTFPSSGRYATHWLGDNWSTFESMRESIPGMLAMGLFGISMVGADICGFAGDTTAELCIRWFQLGSYYPFARNHNILFSNVAQEAYAFGPEATEHIRAALVQRYRLHHYMYGLAASAALNGGSIVRPVFLEFPSDKRTWDLEEQFLLGDSLMVCPQLYEGRDHVMCYLPPSAVWYSSEGELAESNDQIPTPLDTIPTFIRGGSIIPIVPTPGLTIAETRSSDIKLIVALDTKQKASGFAYFDDGESVDSISNRDYLLIEYEARSSSWPNPGSKCRIKGTPVHNKFEETVRLSEVEIFPKCQGSVQFFQANHHNKYSLSLNEPFEITVLCLPMEPLIVLHDDSSFAFE